MKLHLQRCLAACVLFTFALIATLVAAQDVTAALDPALLAKAKSGDAASEYLVAIEFQKGDIVPRDFVQAADWYRKAADQGYAPAQYKLGLLYRQKESGIMKDDAQAAAWLRKAADQGHAGAQSALALSYSRGLGVAQDNAQAVALYQKAVAQNDPGAMVGLALLYSRGQGVPKDAKQAFDLDSKAAALGSADGEYDLGLAYDLGQGVKKDKNQAIDWYRKAAQQGNAGAQFNLGAIDSNHAEAYFWLSIAVDRLDGDAATKATALRDAAAAKLKPAEKAEQVDKASNWRPTPEAHP
jgi:hypothetical protein